MKSRGTSLPPAAWVCREIRPAIDRRVHLGDIGLLHISLSLRVPLV